MILLKLVKLTEKGFDVWERIAPTAEFAHKHDIFSETVILLLT